MIRHLSDRAIIGWWDVGCGIIFDQRAQGDEESKMAVTVGFIICCALLVSSFSNSHASNIDRVPVTNRPSANKIFAASAAAAGLYLGKKYSDGPDFNEKVSMKGKIAVITG